jgi:hypothetical protein
VSVVGDLKSSTASEFRKISNDIQQLKLEQDAQANIMAEFLKSHEEVKRKQKESVDNLAGSNPNPNS